MTKATTEAHPEDGLRLRTNIKITARIATIAVKIIQAGTPVDSEAGSLTATEVGMFGPAALFGCGVTVLVSPWLTEFTSVVEALMGTPGLTS
jgi:hypothetical protein